MNPFAEALERLLAGAMDNQIQVIYIKLKNNKTLVFLGAPVTIEEFEQIEDIVIGECVPTEFMDMGQGRSMTPQ